MAETRPTAKRKPVEARRRAALFGAVVDAQTARPLAGAVVEIASAPAAFTAFLANRARQFGAAWDTLEERPDRSRTHADGHFHFLDLPAGRYTLLASLPGSGRRYGTAQAKVQLKASADAPAAQLALQPTRVTGQVQGPGAKPVPLARVRVQGSGESALTDGAGAFTLLGIEPGKRTIVVSARGLKSAEQTVVLAGAGATKAVALTLSGA